MLKKSNKILSSIKFSTLKKVYGNLDLADFVCPLEIIEILECCFGDYVIELGHNDKSVFISSSAASIVFIKDGQLISEETMLDSYSYSATYKCEVKELGLAYASKEKMFDVNCTTLLPGSIIIFDDQGRCIENITWLDMLIKDDSTYNMENTQKSLYNYFKNKKCILLTSGGIDSAFLISALRDVESIEYASYEFPETGGNNTPSAARCLLKKFYGNQSYIHHTYSSKNLLIKENKICFPEVDIDLAQKLNISDQQYEIISGSNSDTIMAPGYVKGDTLRGIFYNWGIKGGTKALIVNILITLYTWAIARRMIRFISPLINLFIGFWNRRIIYTNWGYYLGSQSSVPFLVTVGDTKKLKKNYDALCEIVPSCLTDGRVGLTFIRLYTKGVANMHIQRGTEYRGCRYVMPFQSAQFIGYCLNRKISLSSVYCPKIPLWRFLQSNPGLVSISFYKKNRINEKH